MSSRWQAHYPAPPQWHSCRSGLPSWVASPPSGSCRRGALTFDHHAHLRHDILPALDLPDPGTDANRMDVVIEWMLAVLSNQIRTSAPWMDKPIALTLRGGIGGGVWTVRPSGSIVRGGDEHAEVIVEATAIEFPEWGGTTRVSWRERDVSIIGDQDYASRFLDQLNVV